MDNRTNGKDVIHRHSITSSKTSSDSTKKSELNASISNSTSCSFGSRSTDSIEDSPKKRLGKWHKSVRLGTGTKTFLNKWKSNSTTFDKSSEDKKEGPAPVDIEEKTVPENESSCVKKSSWSEHVWSTFIHRGYNDDVTKKVPLVVGKDLLTDFQQDKFKYFFYHVLDLNTDHVISAEDFEKLNDRIKHYMDWSVNTIQFLALKEVHRIFLECFLTTSASFKHDRSKTGGEWDPFSESPVLVEKCFVTIGEWLDVWGTLVGKATKVNDLPMWLQFYPKILFDIINRSGSEMI